MAREIISYPELGRVLPGDFTPRLPVEEYLGETAIPEGPVYDVRDFGAVPGSPEVQTEALQAALDACGKTGGTVLVRGRYVSGCLVVRSHTTLFIEKGSELVASRHAEDLIRPDLFSEQDMGLESSGGAFLCFHHAEGVRLTGGGTVSGQGAWYVHPPREEPLTEPADVVRLPTREEIRQGKINTAEGSIRTLYRDRIRYAEDKYGEGLPNLRRPSAMVWFYDCRDVRVDSVVLHDSMCWTLHLDMCDRVEIENMVIDDNRHVANTDGIDLTGCRDVRIRHCLVSCADDGICLKNDAHTRRESARIEIRDCFVISVMNAFKIGTGTRYPIRDVTVSDCTFSMPDLYPGSVCGIAIESCDGSDIERVTVSGIRMHRVTCPLYILLNRRNQAGLPVTEDGEDLCWGGSIRHISIRDVQAEEAELPCIVTGFLDRTPGGKAVRREIQDLTIENFEMRYRESRAQIDVPETIDEFLDEYPESNAHGDVDACGLFVRHVRDMQLSGLKIFPRREDKRPVLSFHDAEGVRIWQDPVKEANGDGD